MTSLEPKTQEQRDAIRIKHLEIENEILKLRIGAIQHELSRVTARLNETLDMLEIYVLAHQQANTLAQAFSIANDARKAGA